MNPKRKKGDHNVHARVRYVIDILAEACVPLALLDCYYALRFARIRPNLSVYVYMRSCITYRARNADADVTDAVGWNFGLVGYERQISRPGSFTGPRKRQMLTQTVRAIPWIIQDLLKQQG